MPKAGVFQMNSKYCFYNNCEDIVSMLCRKVILVFYKVLKICTISHHQCFLYMFTAIFKVNQHYLILMSMYSACSIHICQGWWLSVTYIIILSTIYTVSYCKFKISSIDIFIKACLFILFLNFVSVALLLQFL